MVEAVVVVFDADVMFQVMPLVAAVAVLNIAVQMQHLAQPAEEAVVVEEVGLLVQVVQPELDSVEVMADQVQLF
jgi:hypothetical protein